MRYLRLAGLIALLSSVVLAAGLVPQSALAADAQVSGATCTRVDLAAAVNTASGGGTVTFDCDIPTIDFAANEQIVINADDNVTIDGSNSNGDQIILDGNDLTNFFRVDEGGTLTVQHLTMQHGNAPQASYAKEGGAINVDGGGLTILDCMFLNNHAQLGGALDLDLSEGTFSITQSTFTNNTSEGYAGAIFIYGTLNISQSNFTGNTAAYGGGGIFNDYGGPLTITESSFTNNTSTYLGGAIMNMEQLTIYRSSFVNNDAGEVGGAIVVEDGSLTLVASTLTGNTAPIGSTIYLYGENEWAASGTIAWSTIVQPANTTPALGTDGDLNLVGVLLAGDGEHCAVGNGSLTVKASLTNDDSCAQGSTEAWEMQNLQIGPSSATTVNGVEQTYYPLLEGSPAIDGTLISCDTDVMAGPDLDQIGAPRPYHYYCDIGAIESGFSGGDIVCVNNWNGQLRMAANCGRSETAYTIPSDGTGWLCVNKWNGAARTSNQCSRSEYPLAVHADHTIPTCINRWNGTLRISDHCTRSETQHWL